MNYEKGQRVMVKDCDGRNVSLRVWEEKSDAIFVASDSVFLSLEAGETDVWAIGVPKAYVSAIPSRR